jgi:formyl-CoA transferase/CoA:oxalate CoA-transferase
MAGILDGIRVIDMTIWQQGPYSTAMLADLGADVIHVEGPDTPDMGRNFGGRNAENGLNSYFEAHNRGKRAITLDLKQEQGREILHRLVATADVFMSNMRLKALRRLGADFETLVKLNPRLVYARASGNGPRGPHADHGSMDILGQARGGIMMSQAGADGRPRGANGGIADHVGAITMAFGIVAALLHRERTGEGQEVDSSLLGSQMCVQSFQITDTLFNGNRAGTWGRNESSRPVRPTWNTYQGSDGRWFSLAMNNDSYWPGVVSLLGKPEWLTDERYKDMASRTANSADLVAQLQAIFATQPAQHWIDQFTGRDLLAGPVNAYTDLLADPQTTANGYIVTVPQEGGPPVQMVGAPVIFSKTPAKVVRLAPEFDQNTEEVLLELGFSWEELVELRSQGVIGVRQPALA